MSSTADSGRYKTTGIHTVYDAGGPADGSTYCGTGERRPAVRDLDRLQLPGEHLRGGSSARRPVRAWRGLLRSWRIARRRLLEFAAGTLRNPASPPLPPAASIHRGLPRRAGRAKPARAIGSNSARRPLRPATQPARKRNKLLRERTQSLYNPVGGTTASTTPGGRERRHPWTCQICLHAPL